MDSDLGLPIAFAESPDISALAPALVTAQAEMPSIPRLNQATIKGSRQYHYADVHSVLRLVRPVLSKHGLAVLQPIDGTQLYTRLLHKSGQWMASRMSLGESRDVQALGSTLTYLRRYALIALLAIDTEDEDDDDGHKACRPAVLGTPDMLLSTQLVALQAARDPDGLVEAISRLGGLSGAYKERAWAAFQRRAEALCKAAQDPEAFRETLRHKMQQQREQQRQVREGVRTPEAEAP